LGEGCGVIAALYVEKDGCYWDLPGVDPWDESRDARKYAGPHPVVAHPPCDRWHQLSAVNNKRWGFRINEDGGCFAAALEAVRAFGGVMEHPAETRAFKYHGLGRPERWSWQRTVDGDWITEVNQAAYGHRAAKRTWLLYCGQNVPPRLRWDDVRGSCQIGGFDAIKPKLPPGETSATPPAFRDVLLGIARSASMQARAAA
jgi:hypothetical protein